MMTMVKHTREKVLTKQMLVLTTPQDHDFIRNLAEQNNVSMGDVIRNLINDYRNQGNFNEVKTGDTRQMDMF